MPPAASIVAAVVALDEVLMRVRDASNWRGNSGVRYTTLANATADVNVAYKPNWADGHMMFKADVFNVFNEHAVTNVVEQGENAAGEPQPDRYHTPTGFQSPRSVRFMVQYDF